MKNQYVGDIGDYGLIIHYNGTWYHFLEDVIGWRKKECQILHGI